MVPEGFRQDRLGNAGIIQMALQLIQNGGAELPISLKTVDDSFARLRKPLYQLLRLAHGRSPERLALRGRSANHSATRPGRQNTIAAAMSNRAKRSMISLIPPL